MNRESYSIRCARTRAQVGARKASAPPFRARNAATVFLMLAHALLSWGYTVAAEESPKDGKDSSVRLVSPPPPGYRAKVGYFRGKNGVITITNRPEKYQHQKDYEPIDIQYEPIRVPEQYRKIDRASKYSASTLASLVTRFSRRYGVSPNLVYAVIKTESNFDPDAQSTKGACGLMQLMPATAADMGVTDIFDPAQNIAGGTQYLGKLLKLFDNDLERALAAYNAGPTVVADCGGIPPYEETQNYVRDVMAYARQFARERVGTSYLAKTYHASPVGTRGRARPAAAPEKKCYTIYFRSGLTQPADEINDRDPYYFVRYGNRVDLIRKEHVARIEEPT